MHFSPLHPQPDSKKDPGTMTTSYPTVILSSCVLCKTRSYCDFTEPRQQALRGARYSFQFSGIAHYSIKWKKSKTFLFQLFCLSLAETCVNCPQVPPSPPRLAINIFFHNGPGIKIPQLCGPYIFCHNYSTLVL